MAEVLRPAVELLHDALIRFRTMSSPWGEGWTLCAIAEPALVRGDLDTAETAYQEALDIFGRRGMDDIAAWRSVASVTQRWCAACTVPKLATRG